MHPKVQFASFITENTHMLTSSNGSAQQMCSGGKFNVCVEIQNTAKLNTSDFKMKACPWKLGDYWAKYSGGGEKRENMMFKTTV